MIRFALLILIAIFGSTLARSQTATTGPIMGSEAVEELAPPVESIDETYRILVIGDALGGGLGAGLARMAELETGYDVKVRFKEESGIARSEVYDWSEALPKILVGNDYDAVVVLLGANDRQGIRDGQARLAFNSPEWIAAYMTRTDLILDALAQSGVDVFWVSPPPMADATYDAAMQVLGALQKDRALAKGVRFVDIRAAFLNPDGAYTDTGPDDTGDIRKLRSRDGVTFFKQGNNRLGQLVLDAIMKARGGIDPVPAVPVAEQANVPLFGQAQTDGSDLTLRVADVKVADVLTSDAVQSGSADHLAALKSLAVPGSAAEKLFSLGEADLAPPGRADDFRLAP